jgi:hypothetical protein
MYLVLTLLLLLQLIALSSSQDVYPTCASEDIKTSITTVSGSILETLWVGERNEVILVRTSNALYRSVTFGDSFEQVNLGGKYPDSMAVSSKKTNIVICAGELIYVSIDSGLTFTSYHPPVFFRAFRPHPDNNEWLLAVGLRSTCGSDPDADCAFDLYMSTDFGITWGAIRTYIEGFNWHLTKKNDNTIVVWEHQTKSGNQFGDRNGLKVSVSHDFFSADPRTIDDDVAGYLVTNEHIFYAKRDGAGLSLYASDNAGENRYKVELPLDLAEKRYTILDTSEGFTFINVEHENPEWGYVYSSNGFNRKFSVALKYNARSRNGRCDFAELKNLEGIYYANVHELGEEEGNLVGRYSVITYDKGGIWNRIPYTGADCEKDCYLNLHGRTSFGQYGEWYSRQNAVGLILGAGNVGKYLSYEDEELGTYFSRDAGWTWKKLLSGSFIYEMGNGGSIIVLADDRRATNILHYTWNEGISVHQCLFNDEAIEVINIDSDPLLQSTRFLLTGMRGNSFVLVSLNFDDLHEKYCEGINEPDTQSSDYETWEPSDSRGDLCLLGRKTAYVRRKQEKECLNPDQFTTIKHVIENCSCTEENYECDYCYIRNDIGECVLDTETCSTYDPYTPPAICVGTWERSQGYRRVPGDTCDHVLGIDHTPVVEDCPGQGSTTTDHQTNDFLAEAIIITLPLFGSIAFIASILYYCSGKNEKVRSCLRICLSEDLLPSYTYLDPNADLSDILDDKSNSSELEL